MTAPARGLTKVEYEELLVRAEELERPIVDSRGRGAPAQNPLPPCNVAMVKTAATTLSYSADNVRFLLQRFDETRQALAQSLRNAAKAYRHVDEEYASAITNETSGSGGLMSGPGGVSSGPTLRGAAADAAAPAPLPPQIDELHSLEQTALELEQSDQGASLVRFVDEWHSYQDALREARDRFRHFRNWHGKAADAVNQNFDDHSAWLDAVVEKCGTLADQAQIVVDEFRALRRKHVEAEGKKYGYKELIEFEKFFTEHMRSGYGQFMRLYQEMSQNSERLLGSFKSKAGLPLREVSRQPLPRNPTQIDADILKPVTPPVPRPDPDPGPRPPDPGPGPGPGPGPNPQPDPVVPDGGGGIPDFDGGGLPTPNTPVGPASDDSTGKALQDLKKGLAEYSSGGVGGGVHAASVGGGGGAPLGSRADESLGRLAGAGAGSQGRGGPGAGATGGAAAGGMGGGGAPMGGKGGEGGGKGKRVEGEEEEALYTEDRAWTEGVVGLRSTRDVPGQ